MNTIIETEGFLQLFWVKCLKKYLILAVLMSSMLLILFNPPIFLPIAFVPSANFTQQFPVPLFEVKNSQFAHIVLTKELGILLLSRQ